MARVFMFYVLFYFFNFASLQGTGSGSNGNLRLCVVERRGSYKRAPKFCPILDEENSGVECVIGTDRIDCLRRISKGSVDFGVFSPEDLIAAQWAKLDVLVTNEIKVRNKPFDRSVVAVVNRRILPDSSSTLHSVLRNSTLCHPGVGADDIRPLSDTLSGYLETLVLERSCDPELTLTENRIKALAGFFGKACKAGPWLPDKARDAQLKSLYPSLCAACRTPSKCASTDRYWGDSGALTCLGEAAGDVTWAEYSDVTAYFGLNNATRRSTNSYPSSERFAFLCRDGTWLPLNAAEPCVWLHRPWNVIVAKRKASEAVSKLAESLTNASVAVDQHWRGALASLLENPAAVKEPLRPPHPPPDYLAKARGFREAYSQNGCDPPRHITLCTTSFLEKTKCDWLSEAGAVYGITPPLQCTMKDYTEACISDINKGNADITVASSDWIVRGKRDYQVTPILHEVTPIIEKTNTIVAYVSKKSAILNFNDLKGKRAAFSNYDGAAWHSVLNYITEKEKISCNDFVTDYFDKICAPGANNTFERVSNCYGGGEVDALDWLLRGEADVAFVSMVTYNMMLNNPTQYGLKASDLENITPLCPEENKKYCFINWSSLGHVFAKQNITQMKKQEIINVLENLDKMFGIRPPFSNPMFSMYGPFSHELNVIFHNNTMVLGTDSVFDTYDRIGLNFERKFLNMTESVCSFGGKVTPYLILVTAVIVFNFVM